MNRSPSRIGDPFAARRRRHPGVQWGPADVVGAVALGGALGAVGRYAVYVTWPPGPAAFPWATFAANVIGSFAIGVLLVLVTEVAGRPHRLARPFLGTGVLGGFTTFSTYAVETERLLADGRVTLALMYLFGTLTAALLAAFAGMSATRAVALGRSTEGEMT